MPWTLIRKGCYQAVLFACTAMAGRAELIMQLRWQNWLRQAEEDLRWAADSVTTGHFAGACFLSPVREAAARLDLYYITTRYPDSLPSGVPFEQFTESQAKEALDLAATILGRVKEEAGNGG